MRIRSRKKAMTASAVVVICMFTIQPALAAPAHTVNVPCAASALSAAMTGAASGETLRLAASCRYVMTAALPVITADLTI